MSSSSDLTTIPKIPEEIMNYWRDNLKEELHELMKSTIVQQVEIAAKTAMDKVEAEADKLREKIERQERTVNIYKHDVKELHKEISTMANKNVEHEDIQLEKDKKIALLEKRIAQMELQQINGVLDDLDKQARLKRDIALTKASLITLITAGMGCAVLITEGCKEHDIRRQVPDVRYHKAAESIEKTYG